MTEAETVQRIDKWLWHARFARTRSLAQKLVRAGKIRVDRNRVTSVSHPVRKDSVLTIAAANRVRVIRIKEIAARRGPFSVACTLYEDLSEETKPAPNVARV